MMIFDYIRALGLYICQEWQDCINVITYYKNKRGL